MVHGDDNGLVLHSRIAPVQVMIVPIQQNKEGVLDKAYELKEVLSGFKVKVDDSDKSPDGNSVNPRCAEYRCVWRLPRDLAENQAVLCAAIHTRITVSLDEINEKSSRNFSAQSSTICWKGQREHIARLIRMRLSTWKR